jgi:dTDP-4-dehydrorhamnose 3,5-epimerase
MAFRPTEISDVVVIDVEPRGDERGFLARTYCEHELADHGLVAPVMQVSTVFSTKHTLRGLHFQGIAALGDEDGALHDRPPPSWW